MGILRFGSGTLLQSAAESQPVDDTSKECIPEIRQDWENSGCWVSSKFLA